MDLLAALAAGVGVLAVGCVVAGVVAIRRRRLFGTAVGLTFGALLLALAALFATLGAATRGYRALTREEVAATVYAEPMARQFFAATFTFPDGRRATYDLRGDQLYVDAHILKWKPVANILGLHTAYELDRVGGRYADLEAERDSARTIHSLKSRKLLDMVSLRRRYGVFGMLLDVEYGSATFVPVTEAATFEVRVSTTGLLVRRVGP